MPPALVGGTIATLAGGAAHRDTFPTLLAVGLPPITAIATNHRGADPGQPARGLCPTARNCRHSTAAFVGLVLASVVGAGIGAVLLMFTSNRVFEFLVPLLIGFATILFAFGDRISAAWCERARSRSTAASREIKLTSMPMLLPVSVYGGYFGAGLGVLLVAVLQLATSGEYRPANATKNLVAALNGSAR